MPNGQGFDPGVPDIRAEMEVVDLDIADLERYWPEPTAEKARPWVLKHFRSGRIPRARFVMDFDGSTFGVPGSRPGPFEITLNFDDTTVAYFGDLEPLRNTAGFVSINQDRLEVTAKGGMVGELEVGDISVTMEEILLKGPATTVNFTAYGAVEEVFRIVDQDPLNVIAGRV